MINMDVDFVSREDNEMDVTSDAASDKHGDVSGTVVDDNNKVEPVVERRSRDEEEAMTSSGAAFIAAESDDEVEEESEESDNDDDEDAELLLQADSEYIKPALQQQQEARNLPATDSIFGDFYFAESMEEEKSVENAESPDTLNTAAGKWVDEDTCNTALVNPQKHFVCAMFPAIIKNKDKALATLGGFKDIMEAKKAGKLELRFRPDDPYCKPTIGSYKKNNHLLLKCKRRKVRRDTTTSDPDSVDDVYEYKVEVAGVIDGIFTFKRPCDFQYLPVAKKPETGAYREILTDLLIRFDDERQEFLSRNTPLFLPPYVFSRSEKPAKYAFLSDQGKASGNVGMVRKHRLMGAQRIVFTTKGVPQAANEIAVEKFESLHKLRLTVDPLNELFEERPLWSKTGVRARLKAIGQLKLEGHLNMVAFYFGNGPWIHLWCRFGYDPRLDPSAKMYQTIDFRVRKTWNREQVVAKRGRDVFRGLLSKGLNTFKGHRLPPMGQLGQVKVTDTTGAAPSTSQGGGQTKGRGQSVDVLYQYSPDRLPPYRQMYYQVCDIFEDRIQALAHQNDGQEKECLDRDGWCVPDFVAMSRDIITEHTEKLYT